MLILGRAPGKLQGRLQHQSPCGKRESGSDWTLLKEPSASYFFSSVYRFTSLIFNTTCLFKEQCVFCHKILKYKLGIGAINTIYSIPVCVT